MGSLGFPLLRSRGGGPLLLLAGTPSSLVLGAVAALLAAGCVGGQSGTPHPSYRPQCEEVDRAEVVDRAMPAPGHTRSADEALAELLGSWAGSCGELQLEVSAAYAGAPVESVTYRWEDHGDASVEPQPCNPVYETRLRSELWSPPRLEESIRAETTLTSEDGSKRSRWSARVPLDAVEGTIRPSDSHPANAELELFAGGALDADGRLRGRLMWFGQSEREDGTSEAFQEPVCDLVLSRAE